MPKAIKVSARSISPASVPAHIKDMIRRHGELYRKTDQLYDVGGDKATETAEYNDAIDESIDLENRIVATRAKSRADITAKRRFIRDTAFISGDGCETGDLGTLVEMILQLDAEAVGATIPELEVTAEQRDVERFAAAGM